MKEQLTLEECLERFREVSVLMSCSGTSEFIDNMIDVDSGKKTVYDCDLIGNEVIMPNGTVIPIIMDEKTKLPAFGERRNAGKKHRLNELVGMYAYGMKEIFEVPTYGYDHKKRKEELITYITRCDHFNLALILLFTNDQEFHDWSVRRSEIEKLLVGVHPYKDIYFSLTRESRDLWEKMKAKANKLADELSDDSGHEEWLYEELKSRKLLESQAPKRRSFVRIDKRACWYRSVGEASLFANKSYSNTQNVLKWLEEDGCISHRAHFAWPSARLKRDNSMKSSSKYYVMNMMRIEEIISEKYGLDIASIPDELLTAYAEIYILAHMFLSKHGGAKGAFINEKAYKKLKRDHISEKERCATLKCIYEDFEVEDFCSNAYDTSTEFDFLLRGKLRHSSLLSRVHKDERMHGRFAHDKFDVTASCLRVIFAMHGIYDEDSVIKAIDETCPSKDPYMAVMYRLAPNDTKDKMFDSNGKITSYGNKIRKVSKHLYMLATQSKHPQWTDHQAWEFFKAMDDISSIDILMKELAGTSPCVVNSREKFDNFMKHAYWKKFKELKEAKLSIEKYIFKSWMKGINEGAALYNLWMYANKSMFEKDFNAHCMSDMIKRYRYVLYNAIGEDRYGFFGKYIFIIESMVMNKFCNSLHGSGLFTDVEDVYDEVYCLWNEDYFDFEAHGFNTVVKHEMIEDMLVEYYTDALKETCEHVRKCIDKFSKRNKEAFSKGNKLYLNKVGSLC